MELFLKNYERGRAATKTVTIKAEQIRRAGNHAYTCTIGMDLGQILSDFQNERQRCKSLGGSGGMLPMGILFILTSQSPLSWVSQPFRQDIGQFLLLG